MFVNQEGKIGKELGKMYEYATHWALVAIFILEASVSFPSDVPSANMVLVPLPLGQLSLCSVVKKD